MVGVDEDLDEIVGFEHGVPAHFVGHDPARLAVETTDAEVDGLRVIEDPHFGPFGGLLALSRFALDEPPRSSRLGPGRLIKPPVDFDGTGRPHGPSAIILGIDGSSQQSARKGQDGQGQGQFFCVRTGQQDKMLHSTILGILTAAGVGIPAKKKRRKSLGLFRLPTERKRVERFMGGTLRCRFCPD